MKQLSVKPSRQTHTSDQSVLVDHILEHHQCCPSKIFSILASTRETNVSKFATGKMQKLLKNHNQLEVPTIAEQFTV